MLHPMEYIHNNNYIAEVIRTGRCKTVTINVDDCTVSIVVPRELSEERIKRVLTAKDRWIKQKIASQQSQLPVNQKQFISGESFSYLGRNYRLKVKRVDYQPLKLLNGYLVATLPDGADNPLMVRHSLVKWYNAQAKPKLIEKTKRYAGIVGVSPTAIEIKSYKSRWGNCNVKGGIGYNWKIVMAPQSVVDYVVVHELCHLKHFNHSTDYWRQVERILPNYMDSKRWLKEHRFEIDF